MPTSELFPPPIAVADFVAPLPGEHTKPHNPYEMADRMATVLVTVVLLFALAFGAIQARGGALHWYDLVVFMVCYVPLGLGITIGYHRMLTHRAFTARPAVRATFAILGSMAIEGPPIEWVANHRKHHAFSDEVGDLHSPHVDHGGGWGEALRACGTRIWAGCFALRLPTNAVTPRTYSPTR